MSQLQPSAAPQLAQQESNGAHHADGESARAAEPVMRKGRDAESMHRGTGAGSGVQQAAISSTVVSRGGRQNMSLDRDGQEGNNGDSAAAASSSVAEETHEVSLLQQ